MSETLAERNLRVALTIAERFSQGGLELVLAIAKGVENGDQIMDVMSVAEPEQIYELLTALLLEFDKGEITRYGIAPGLEGLEP